MSDISAVQITKWSGIVSTELVKWSVVTDDMTIVRDLNDAEACKIYRSNTQTPGEVAAGADRTSGGESTDDAISLVHNPSLEANEPVKWENQNQVPVDLIGEKMPILGQKMAFEHARRFFAYGVSTVSNYDGASTPDHIILDDFTIANSAINTSILNAMLLTRQKFIAQGHMCDPQNTFAAVSPFVFGRMHTIQEVKGREFVFEGNGGVRRFKAFEYGDITWFETPCGLGENLSALGTAQTPAKWKKDLTLFHCFAWAKRGLAQGFIGGGAFNRGDIPNPVRHVITSVNYYWQKKTHWINTAMIYDNLFVYPNGDGDESVLAVAWKSTV